MSSITWVYEREGGSQKEARSWSVLCLVRGTRKRKEFLRREEGFKNLNRKRVGGG